MKKNVVLLTPPQGWESVCTKYQDKIDFHFVSPLRCVPRDDTGFSNFLMDLVVSKYDVVVMTCPTVVRYSIQMAEERGMLDRFLSLMKNVKVVTIGNRSLNIANGAGLRVSSVSPEVSTESLVRHINDLPLRGRVALLRSDRGTDILPSGLRASGWEVTEIPIYSMRLCHSEEMELLLDGIEEHKVDALLFPSPALAEAFIVQLRDRADGCEEAALLEGMAIGVMGHETKIKLAELGVKVDIMPEKATSDDLIRATVNRLEAAD